jgi:hypothetical protein
MAVLTLKYWCTRYNPTSLGIDQVAVDVGHQSGLEGLGQDQVYGGLEQLLEVALGVHVVVEGGIGELDQQIDVTAGHCLAAGVRAE